MNAEHVMEKFAKLETDRYRESAKDRARKMYKKIYQNGNFDRQINKKEFDAVDCLSDAMVDQEDYLKALKSLGKLELEFGVDNVQKIVNASNLLKSLEP